MKKMIYIALAALLCTSCIRFNPNSKSSTSSDENTTRNIYDMNFNAIEFDGVGAVNFIQGDTCLVKVEGDRKQVDNLTIELDEDGTLEIDERHSIKMRDVNLVITIQAPSIKRIETDGVGRFTVKGDVVLQGDLEIESDGVGALKVENLKCRSLRVKHDGVGACEVNANCRNVYFESDGVGANKLTVNTDTLTVKSEGVGSTTIKGSTRFYNVKSDDLLGRVNAQKLKVKG